MFFLKITLLLFAPLCWMLDQAVTFVKCLCLLLGRNLLATLGLLGTQALATILLEDTWGAIGLGALLQCVEGDGQQLVTLTLGITQLEAVEIIQLRAL